MLDRQTPLCFLAFLLLLLSPWAGGERDSDGANCGNSRGDQLAAA
jgi:hypothetical protein